MSECDTPTSERLRDLAQLPQYAEIADVLNDAAMEIHDANVVIDMSEKLWTDEQCFHLNAGQHNSEFHGYTCGNDSNHSPLIATRDGWRCAYCDYRQRWSHETGGPTS